MNRVLPLWKAIPPTENSAWSDGAFEILLGEWGVGQDERLPGWVHENCGAEMRATVDALLSGTMNDTKRSGIKHLLHQNYMPPRAFTGVPPAATVP